MDQIFYNIFTVSIERVGDSYVVFIEHKDEGVKTFEHDSVMLNIFMNEKCVLGIDNPETLEPYCSDDYSISKVVVAQEHESLYVELYFSV